MMLSLLSMCSCSQKMTPKSTTKTMLTLFVFVVSNLFFFVDAGYPMGCNYFLSPIDLTASTAVKTIRLPIVQDQLYLANQHCEWMINTEQPDQVVQVFIKYCNVQGRDLSGDCLQDYLDFYEVKNSGEQIFMGRYCGGKCQGKLLETTSSNMMIHFISDSHYQYDGFVLTYMAQPKKETESEDNSTTALAVGISVGLISLALAVIVIICFYRRWFAIKDSQSHPPSSPPSSCQRNRSPSHTQQQEPRLHPQLIASEQRHYDDSRFGNDHNPTLQESLPAYSAYDAAPLRVDIPLENSDSLLHSQVQRRSSSTSPSPATFSTFAATNRISATGVNSADYDGGDDVSGANGSRRSETPPPSYEFTVMHDRMMGQQQDGDVIVLPQFPPDYDSVVKESQF